MFRDLLLPTTGTSTDATALVAGVQLARTLGARLAVLETVSLPMSMPAPWGGCMPVSLLQEVHAPLLARGAANVERLQGRLAGEGIAHEVRLAEALFAEPPQVAALHARHADVTLLGGLQGLSSDDAAMVRRMFTGLLFESGRPLLVVPPNPPCQWSSGHVVVAWQPTREAARALHDAMPLLARAKTVDVLLVNPQPRSDGHGELPGADIGAHLARHGLEVNVVRRERGRDSVATALLRHAAETQAGLLVAGGFGHSRLREWILGGTTRELLDAQHLPLLFSH